MNRAGIESYIEGRGTISFEPQRFEEARENLVNLASVASAENILLRAMEGLRAQTRRFEEFGIIINPEEPASPQIPDQEKRAFALNYSAGIFALIVLGLDRAVNRGVISNLQFIQEYNELVDGTFIPKVKEPAIKETALSEQELRRMIDTIEETDRGGKTYSRFFEDRYSQMPDIFKDLLEQTGALPNIRRFIIPVHNGISTQIATEIGEQRGSEFTNLRYEDVV